MKARSVYINFRERRATVDRNGRIREYNNLTVPTLIRLYQYFWCGREGWAVLHRNDRCTSFYFAEVMQGKVVTA